MTKSTNKRTINKEQFYTRPEDAKRIAEWVNKTYDFDEVVEPSAGEGVWLKHFTNITAYDLEPKAEGIIEQDFLDLTLPYNDRRIVVGNPPFGRRGSLAIRFVNKASEIAPKIVMILPACFAKTSTQKALNKRLHLIHQEPMLDAAFTGEKGDHPVRCVLQAWELRDYDRIDKPTITETEDFYFTDHPELCDFAVRTHGAGVGQLFSEGVLDLSRGTTAFVVANIDPAILYERFSQLDYWEWARWGTTTPVVAKTEIIWLYEKKFA